MPVLMIQDLEQRIDRGAKWLDEKRPNWAKHVLVRQLDVSKIETSPVACVLGENWDETLTYREAYDYAFDFSLLNDSDTVELINKMWKAQISMRRAKKSRTKASA